MIVPTCRRPIQIRGDCTMAKKTTGKAEERFAQLLDGYDGDRIATTIWEVKAALQLLHGNHGSYKAVESLYWDKAWAR